MRHVRFVLVFTRACISIPAPPLFAHTATLSILDFCKKFFSENFSLRIKIVLWKFFSDFFIFIFHSSHTPPICRYYPFICPTIARNTFYVQLVVGSNFNRLQRKYERLCIVWASVFSIPVWVENKKLETFSRFVWWLGRKVLTLQP